MHWKINNIEYYWIISHAIYVQVSADLQNEVLMSLLETDPDVVDYLLRRKASQ